MRRGVSLLADRPCCKTRLYNTVKSSSSQSFYTASCINNIGLRRLLVYLVSQPQLNRTRIIQGPKGCQILQFIEIIFFFFVSVAIKSK